MIVNDLKAYKNYYLVIIDNKEYKFSEDTIVNFRLVKGKELSKDTLKKALQSEDLNYFYNKALQYQIRYMKGRAEIFNYLISKGVSINNANIILNKLEDTKILDDKMVASSLTRSYIKDKNGILLIKEKLKDKGFKNEIIEEVLNEIDYDSYFDSLNSLYNKIKNKYDKFDDYIRVNKIKAYLLSRGYTFSDISELNIK